MNKKDFSERDICTKFITPAVKQAGWDEMSQIREEVSFTKGRIIVRGKLVTRGKAKRADYVLSESSHFTPWLAQEENLKLLGETIGIELEYESQEKGRRSQADSCPTPVLAIAYPH